MAAARWCDADGLIGDIYDAALDASLWPRLIARLCGVFDASSATLVRPAARSPAAAMVSVGMDPEANRRYLAHFCGIDPITRAIAGLPAGTVTTDRMVVPQEEMRRSEFYNDFLAPMDVDTTIGATLAERAASLLGLSRTLHGGEWAEDDIGLLRRLAPHLRRAVEINRRLEDAELGSADDAALLLERMPHPVLLLDAGGRIAFANRAAEQLIGEADGVRYAGGMLQAATPALTVALLAAIARSGADAEAGDALLLPRPSGRRPFLALIARASLGIEWRLRPRPSVMVILVDAPPANGLPPIGALPPEGPVALSARERDCLRGVAAGGSSKKIASELGLSPYTVDQYVDSAMRKLNAGSRAEAVAKAYALGLVA